MGSPAIFKGTRVKFLTGSNEAEMYDGGVVNWAREVTGSFASPIAITAGGGVTPTNKKGDELIFVEGSGGPVDISANPQIAALANGIGKIVMIVGTDATNTVLFEDGNGLSMNGSMNLSANSMISFVWDGLLWREIYRVEQFTG